MGDAMINSLPSQARQFRARADECRTIAEMCNDEMRRPALAVLLPAYCFVV